MKKIFFLIILLLIIHRLNAKESHSNFIECSFTSPQKTDLTKIEEVTIKEEISFLNIVVSE